MKIVTTNDGSNTLQRSELQENYHSIHGAHQESLHVFIHTGLLPLLKKDTIKILEMGFGTGLNALLTLDVATRENQSILYSTIENYPLKWLDVTQLHYPSLTNLAQHEEDFKKMHDGLWESNLVITPLFSLKKYQTNLENFDTDERFDLVYFDAFSPRTQPELWTQAIFEKMYALMNTGAVLVTYCAKGQVRRDMQAAGFEVTRMPGPPGKREMLKALKNQVSFSNLWAK